MKNRLAILGIFLAFLALPMAAYAQGKVGIISINGAIASTGEGKKAMADLQKKYEPKRQELERLQKEIQNIQDQLNKPTPALSDDDQSKLTRDLEDKQKNLKRWTDDAQSDFAADRDDALRRVGQKMVRIIEDYAQQNGFALVIDGAQIPIYYAAKGLDLTEEMVKRYDAANPVADAGASAKPAARPAAPAPATKPQ
jgi:outer membrane protein